jgi:L-ascorbate metabolism protein UlaG (beta-lactamase superfamily)
MEITYHGNSCIRLRGRNATVLIDPTDSQVKKLTPDLVVRTSGTTNPDLLRVRDEGPQEVRGPGEFEVVGVAIHGVAAGDITIMSVEVDDVRVANLGALDRQLSEDEIDEIGHIDVLALPVGGAEGGLSAAAAVKLARTVEPPVVIPVSSGPGEEQATLDSIDSFLKEMGLKDGVAAQPKLTLTGGLTTADDTRVVVLESRG